MLEPIAMCDRHASRRHWRLISSGLPSPILMALIVGVLLIGCRSQKASADPAIEFAKIDAAALLDNDARVAEDFDAKMRLKDASIAD